MSFVTNLWHTYSWSWIFASWQTLSFLEHVAKEKCFLVSHHEQPPRSWLAEIYWTFLTVCLMRTKDTMPWSLLHILLHQFLHKDAKWQTGTLLIVILGKAGGSFYRSVCVNSPRELCFNKHLQEAWSRCNLS